MATTQHDSDSGEGDSAATEQGGFGLTVRSFDKTDDGGITASDETYTREEWVKNGPSGATRDLWSTLAEQSHDGTDLQGKDTELVAIRVMGYIEDFAEVVGMSPGYDGPEWTLATVNRYDDVADPESGEYPGPPQAPAPDEWAHEPIFEGWDSCVSFQSVYNSERGRFQPARYTHDYPKAAGLLVVYPEGTPTALDQEELTRADGLAENDDGHPEWGSEWTYERAIETARERVERAHAETQHEVDTSGIEALADEYPPQVAAAALRGKMDGQNRYVEAAPAGADVDAFARDALASAASGAIECLLDELPEETTEDVVEALREQDDE
jgi:hypothetical protein